MKNTQNGRRPIKTLLSKRGIITSSSIAQLFFSPRIGDVFGEEIDISVFLVQRAFKSADTILS